VHEIDDRARAPWEPNTYGWDERDTCRVLFSPTGAALNPRFAMATSKVQPVERMILRIVWKRGGWRALLGIGPFPNALVMGMDGALVEVPLQWLLQP
jgi:hypothetical protein